MTQHTSQECRDLKTQRRPLRLKLENDKLPETQNYNKLLFFIFVFFIKNKSENDTISEKIRNIILFQDQKTEKVTLET